MTDLGADDPEMEMARVREAQAARPGRNGAA